MNSDPAASSPATRPRVAVIGSGVAGLVAAYTASRVAHVTLYEADDRLGGHADTHRVVEGGRTLAIDTGFIVHNRRTYPVLLSLFEELGVPTQPSEMSMSIRDDATGLEWAGARGLRGLVPTPRHLANLRHLRMLAEIPRFHRRARQLLDRTDGGAETTLAEFVEECGFSAHFVRHFMEPLVAAVWSCDPLVAGQYPARYLFSFLAHHGMLSVSGSPTWRTVTGGSVTYVDRVAARLDEIRLGCAVVEVVEDDECVSVRDAGGDLREFDRVVVATHPDQALALLGGATVAQKEVLGAMEYSANQAVLHTDASILPRAGSLHSSWNFRRTREAAGPVTVTYDLTRLQRLDTAVRYLVTLGGEDLVDPAKVIARRDYAHPLYTPASVAAQARLPQINTDRIAFAGAYHGWGFHEDGARSGLAAARRLGLDTSDALPVTPREPEPVRTYATTIRHVRRTAATDVGHRRVARRSFVHRSSWWLVELPGDGSDPTAGPDWRRWLRGSVEARDHLGDPDRPVRENLARFLAARGIELGEARVLLATHPRAFGFCFNPISVFWCLRPDGTSFATVLEVHNTYGDRHAYLVRPDERGRATVAKAMYVSPFHGTDGMYAVTAPVPSDELEVAIRLTTPDGGTFAASVRGRRTRATPVRSAVVGLRNAILIRVHGVVLWARRLPIRPRPDHHQEGVQ